MEEKKTCFVITKYNDKGRSRYGQLIKPFIHDVLENFEPVLAEATEQEGEKPISQIHKDIDKCVFCIADISEPSEKTSLLQGSEMGKIVEGRENIFYEIGYAIGKGKPVLLVKCVTNTLLGEIPFNIQHCSIIGYQDISIAPVGFNLLLKIWISQNFQKIDEIKFYKPLPTPSKKWLGSWIMNKAKHNIVMEQITKEEMVCTIDIPNYKGNHYRVKEVVVHQKQYSATEKEEQLEEGLKGIWRHFVGVAFYNEIEEFRLDYLLDGFAIRENVENGELEAFVWNKPSINNKQKFTLTPIITK